MKKLVLFLFSLWNIMGLQTHAQVQQDTFPWCPPGARWVYDGGYSLIFSTDRTLYVLIYESDTIIQGKLCKKLVQYGWNQGWNNAFYFMSHGWGYGPYYLHQSNDTIFYWNVFKQYTFNDSLLGDSTFKIAYLFNPQIGDSIEINSLPINHCTELLYKQTQIFHSCYVDSIYEQVLNGYSYKTIRMTDGPYWSVGREIVRNIGGIYGFLPSAYHDVLGINPPYDSSNCDYFYIMNTAHHDRDFRKLICYYDPLRGAISFPDVVPWNQNVPCDSTTFKQAKSNSIFETEETIIAYPNPVKNILFIKGDGFDLQNANVDLYDVNGKCIEKSLYRIIDLSVIKEVDIDYLPSGIYFVQIVKNNGKVKTIRFVKE